MMTSETSVVATIRLTDGNRGTIRIHCEECGWIITCDGQDAVIAPQASREAENGRTNLTAGEHDR